MIARYTELRPTKPMKRVNKARKSKEFIRTFLSVARVQFIQRLHCIVDGCESTRSETAHVCDDGTKGGSRRAGYKCTAPLCRDHHHELDEQLGPVLFAEKYGLDLEAEAAKAQRSWERVVAHCSAEFECDVDFNEEDTEC